MSDYLRPPQPSREQPDSSPFDEPITSKRKTLSPRGFVAGLRDRPDLLILATFLALDALLLLLNITWGRIEPSHLWESVSWLRCRPFLDFQNSIDATFFALAGWQLALMSTWAVFSGRRLVVKGLIIGVFIMMLVLWMVVAVNGIAANLLDPLVFISLGSVLVSTWLWSRGWKWSGGNANRFSTKRIGTREIMFATALVALFCMLTGYALTLSNPTTPGHNLWRSVCNYLAFLLVGTATGVVSLIACAPGDAGRLTRYCVAVLVSAVIVAVCLGLHLFKNEFFIDQFFNLYRVNRPLQPAHYRIQQLAGVAFWMTLLLSLHAASMFILVTSGYHFSKATPQKLSTLKLVVQYIISATGIAAMYAAGYVSWLVWQR